MQYICRSVVIIHHNVHHNSYISFYIFGHLLWHAQQNSQDITKNLNKFFPFELRTFFGKAVFNGSASGLCELSTSWANSSVKLLPLWTLEGFTTWETVTASWKPIHIKGISPQAHKQWWITSTCEDLWGFLFKKVHCFEFRACASSAYWSSIKLATCSAPLKASTWITSGTKWDSDVPTCEAVKMQNKTKASVDVLAPPRCRETRFWTFWNLLEVAGSLASVTPSLGHQNLYVDSSFALESI